MKWLLALLVLSAPVTAETVSVPSGQMVRFVNVIKDAPGSGETTWRFRFVAPEIKRDRGVENAADLDAICADFVVPRVIGSTPMPQEVIVSVSDRAVEFGVANPDATQVFEAYRIEGQSCVWEGL